MKILNVMLIVLFCSGLFACGSFSEGRRVDRLSDTLRTYNAAVRWGHFEDAAAYRADQKIVRSEPAPPPKRHWAQGLSGWLNGEEEEPTSESKGGVIEMVETVKWESPEPIDINYLRNIRVTGFQERGLSVEKNATRAVATVEFRFYDTYSGKERRIVDKQIWDYNDDSKLWRLAGNLPDFKESSRR